MNRTKIAGFLYNFGNIILFLTIFQFQYLSAFSAFLFFVAGLVYMRGGWAQGNLLSGMGAVVLSLDLFLQTQYLSAVLMLVCHAGGKLIGAFPDRFEARYQNAPQKWVRLSLGTPQNTASFGPMISRLPVAIDSLITHNYILLVTALIWLAGDYCILRGKSVQ